MTTPMTFDEFVIILAVAWFFLILLVIFGPKQ